MSFWNSLPLLMGAGAQMYGAYSQGRIQQQIGQMNYQSEVQNRQQQLALQKEAWKREDNAVSRRVADLKASGLSPVLAAGSAATSSSPIRTEAPKMSDEYAKSRGAMGDVVGSAPARVMSIIEQANTLRQQEETIAKTKAERDAISLQTLRNSTQHDIDRARLMMMPFQQQLLESNVGLSLIEQEHRKSMIENHILDRELTHYNLEQSRRLGMRTNDPSSPWGLGTGAMRSLFDGLSSNRSQAGPKSKSRGQRSVIEQQLFDAIMRDVNR